MPQLWWRLYRSGVLVAHDGLISVSTAMNDEVIDLVLERFAKVLMDPVIITIATTGSATTRRHTPHVPLTPEEIAEEIHLSWQAGAAIAHVHVRDAQGRACMDFARFRRVVELVRGRCDIILNLSSSGLSVAGDDERIRPLADCSRRWPPSMLGRPISALGSSSITRLFLSVWRPP